MLTSLPTVHRRNHYTRLRLFSTTHGKQTRRFRSRKTQRSWFTMFQIRTGLWLGSTRSMDLRQRTTLKSWEMPLPPLRRPPCPQLSSPQRHLFPHDRRRPPPKNMKRLRPLPLTGCRTPRRPRLRTSSTSSMHLLVRNPSLHERSCHHPDCQLGLRMNRRMTAKSPLHLLSRAGLLQNRSPRQCLNTIPIRLRLHLVPSSLLLPWGTVGTMSKNPLHTTEPAR
jgi:hypothetical protein